MLCRAFLRNLKHTLCCFYDWWGSEDTSVQVSNVVLWLMMLVGLPEDRENNTVTRKQLRLLRGTAAPRRVKTSSHPWGGEVESLMLPKPSLSSRAPGASHRGDRLAVFPTETRKLALSTVRFPGNLRGWNTHELWEAQALSHHDGLLFSVSFLRQQQSDEEILQFKKNKFLATEQSLYVQLHWILTITMKWVLPLFFFLYD